jgi:hypothetical protein
MPVTLPSGVSMSLGKRKQLAAFRAHCRLEKRTKQALQPTPGRPEPAQPFRRFDVSAKHSTNGATRACLYLRKSTDEQEQSIDRQRDQVTRYAQRRGYQRVAARLRAAGGGDQPRSGQHRRAG